MDEDAFDDMLDNDERIVSLRWAEMGELKEAQAILDVNIEKDGNVNITHKTILYPKKINIDAGQFNVLYIDAVAHILNSVSFGGSGFFEHKVEVKN